MRKTKIKFVFVFFPLSFSFSHIYEIIIFMNILKTKMLYNTILNIFKDLFWNGMKMINWGKNINEINYVQGIRQFLFCCWGICRPKPVKSFKYFFFVKSNYFQYTKTVFKTCKKILIYYIEMTTFKALCMYMTCKYR